MQGKSIPNESVQGDHSEKGLVGAIVLAAGRGERMGGGEKKQFRLLGDKPVLAWSVEAFIETAQVDNIVIVTGRDDISRIQEMVQSGGWSKVSQVVAGGETRQQSVWSGLQALPASTQWVLIHDGVRPMVDAPLISTVLTGARQFGAATCGLPVKETIKVVSEDHTIVHTPDRQTLWAAQTPQAFSFPQLLEAHKRAQSGGESIEYTDDCSLIESAGQHVAMVRGTDENIKITTEFDLKVAEALVTQPMRSVTGFGFDVHRLEEGRPLILGGVTFDYPLGLAGHSDADVLTHAVIDALLGAMSLGDIGTHFPDTDPRYKGADSIELLQVVCEKVRNLGGRIRHIDAFVSAERPKLNPSINDIREKLGQAMDMDVSWINVKAGTGEERGPVGRGEVIEARVVATVDRPIT